LLTLSGRIPERKPEDNTKWNVREFGRKDIRCMEVTYLAVFAKPLSQYLLEILDVIAVLDFKVII
jgi:hypothetical protein